MQITTRICTLALFTSLAGCAITPQEFSPAEISSIIQEDRASVPEAAVIKETSVITLSEAIARALKFNLDQRVQMLSQSLAAGELDAGKYDMLPKLLANAGYDWRNNYSQRYDGPAATPTVFPKSPLPDISIDPSHATADLHLSWNILDFGASYYSARQNADRLLIANEKRRKAMHLLIQKVRTAYWRALAAEKLSHNVRNTIDEAEQALNESEKLVTERVSQPDQALRYQRNLLENLRLLEGVERELASARIELTQLMGALPGSQFTLVEPNSQVEPLQLAIEDMEAQALTHNASLKIELFNARVAALDTRKALLKLLPGITLDYGTYYDNDRYLVNEDWNAASLKVSFNLFNLLAAPSRLDAADKNELLAKARRMALQMTVLTQVHLAAHQYTDALRQYRRAEKISNVDSQLESIVNGKYQGSMVSEQTKIASHVTTILSELRRYQSMSKLQQAIGEIQTSMGMEPDISSLDDQSLEELSQYLNNWLQEGLMSVSVQPVQS